PPPPASRSSPEGDTVGLIRTAGAAFAAVAAGAILAPRFLKFSSPTAVLVLAVLGAVLGAVAPGAPTKIAVLDGVLRARFGAVCVLAAATTGPRARLAAAVVV